MADINHLKGKKKQVRSTQPITDIQLSILYLESIINKSFDAFQRTFQLMLQLLYEYTTYNVDITFLNNSKLSKIIFRYSACNMTLYTYVYLWLSNMSLRLSASVCSKISSEGSWLQELTASSIHLVCLSTSSTDGRRLMVSMPFSFARKSGNLGLVQDTSLRPSSINYSDKMEK